MTAKTWGLAALAIVGLAVLLPCLPVQADHWQGHEQWERKLWDTYTPGPTPSILSPGAGKSRHKGDVRVRGHTRKGTSVRPHMRSAPDGDKGNNFSTRGNVNPYTGKPGYRSDDEHGPNGRLGAPVLHDCYCGEDDSCVWIKVARWGVPPYCGEDDDC